MPTHRYYQNLSIYVAIKQGQLQGVDEAVGRLGGNGDFAGVIVHKPPHQVESPAYTDFSGGRKTALSALEEPVVIKDTAGTDGVIDDEQRFARLRGEG